MPAATSRLACRMPATILVIESLVAHTPHDHGDRSAAPLHRHLQTVSAMTVPKRHSALQAPIPDGEAVRAIPLPVERCGTSS